MSNLEAGADTIPANPAATVNTSFAVLGAISFSHMINDMIQSLIVAIYPVLKSGFNLSFGEIGLITLTYQLTASLLQPVVGLYTDHRPQPYSLPFGMGFTLAGILLLSVAPGFYAILLAAALVGTGSSIFHPESSRVARMASGGKHGLAQSLFQVGGNFGTSLGPLCAAAIVVPYGRRSIGWFAFAAMVAIIVLVQIGKWYSHHRLGVRGNSIRRFANVNLSRAKVVTSICILLTLIFSKYFYLACIANYLSFFLIDKFQLSVQSAQMYLFAFLFSVALGTVIGGPIGDRIGRKYVIWASILGVAPFTLLLPHVNLFWTGVLIAIIGLVLASAFSAILVYAQELIPGKIGMVSGLFFGFAFGMGGIGAAALGHLADRTNLEFVFLICSFLPLLGVVAAFLPDLERAPTGRS